jgi:hypothetical protein
MSTPSAHYVGLMRFGMRGRWLAGWTTREIVRPQGRWRGHKGDGEVRETVTMTMMTMMVTVRAGDGDSDSDGNSEGGWMQVQHKRGGGGAQVYASGPPAYTQAGPTAACTMFKSRCLAADISAILR